MGPLRSAGRATSQAPPGRPLRVAAPGRRQIVPCNTSSPDIDGRVAKPHDWGLVRTQRDMATLRSAVRLSSLSRTYSRSAFARLPGFGAAHRAGAAMLVRAQCAAAAELAKQPIMENSMFCYQARLSP